MKNVSLLCSLFLLLGCGAAHFTDYTTIEEINCPEKADQMYLFFDGETVPEDYKKLGLIEVHGNMRDSSKELLTIMKHKAWHRCANGLIHISKDYAGEYSHDEQNGLRKDSKKIFTGLAVQFEVDRAFLAEHGSGTDTSFIKDYKRLQKEEEKNKQRKGVLAAVGGIATILIVAIIQSAIESPNL